MTHAGVNPQLMIGLISEVRRESRRRVTVASIARYLNQQLKQAFLNLILNALQAVGDFGRIRITTQAQGGMVTVRVRDEIWKYYQRLKAYRESPTSRRRSLLERDFDRLFLQRTGWGELNDALRKIHGKRENLLLVLDRPEIPLHNNLSENDIRQYAKKRKISAGTRSDLGRRCRDTFLSLKTTCRKLGVTFWQYLQDRINDWNRILPLPELLRRKVAETT